MIDESKVEKMLQKEIEKQVKKKLEHLNLYELQDEVVRSVVWSQIGTWMDKNQKEISRAVNSHISIDKEDWEEDVKKAAVDELFERMGMYFRA